MKKKIITTLSVVLTVMLSLSVFTACSKNKHKYSTDWKYDETSHWHECTTKKHKDTRDFAAHDFGAGVVTAQPTEEAEGLKTLTCGTCGYQKTEKVPKLAHTHKFNANVWEKDADNHWHPATCEHTAEKGSLEKHVWNDGTVTTEPTETEEGVKTYTCTKCGQTKTAAIGKKDHEHTFNDSVWAHDSENHWHPATCAHTDERNSVAAHEWNDGEITTPAGYGTAGEKTYKCKICDAKRTEPIAALNAKDNTVALADGVTLDKVYDGTPVSLTAAQVVRSGGGNVTIRYKLKAEADDKYVAAAPKAVGKYTVKIVVEATAEWKSGEMTKDFAVTKKSLTTEPASKVYDGNATMSATLVGVVDGEEVTATVTMTSKKVGADVLSVELSGKDAGNYEIDKTQVEASITPVQVTIEWEREYNNSKLFSGEPVGKIEGDDVIFNVYTKSADVGAEYDCYNKQGADSANYTVDPRDISVSIVKASVGNTFVISNADEYTAPFKVGEPIPDPVTGYVEIGTGYGAKTVVWEQKNGERLWIDTTKALAMKAAGEYRARIEYAEGKNYYAATTEYVHFTVVVKERTATMQGLSYISKTYDKQTCDLSLTGVGAESAQKNAAGENNCTNYTDPAQAGERYVEVKKDDGQWEKVTDSSKYPLNAGSYSYRFVVGATSEWGGATSSARTVKINPFVIKLKYGYIATSNNLQNGDQLFLESLSPIEGELLALRLVNGYAGLELTSSGSAYLKKNQKKAVSIENNFNSFTLRITKGRAENYTLGKSTSTQKTVEIAVVESAKGVSNTIQKISSTGTEVWIVTSVKSGYFQVGQTVQLCSSSGAVIYEGKIVKVGPLSGGSYSTSPSGCVIPSDGTVHIDVGIPGTDFSSISGGFVKVK